MIIKINRLQIIVKSNKSVEKLLDEWNDIHTEIKELKKTLEDAKGRQTKVVNKLLPKMVILEDAAYEYNGIVYKIIQYTAGKSISYKQVVEFIMDRVNAKLRKEIEDYQESITTRKNPKPTELKTKKAQINGLGVMVQVLNWGIKMLKNFLNKGSK